MFSSCDEYDDGSRLLRADASIDCDGTDYSLWLLYASSMVVVYQ